MPHLLISKSTPLFYCTLFFKEYLNPQVGINKMANEYDVKRTPPWSFRINLKEIPHSSIDLLGLCFSPEFLLNRFSNMHVSPCLKKIFKYMVFTLLVNAFGSQKIESSLLMLQGTTLPQVPAFTPHADNIFSKICCP